MRKVTYDGEPIETGVIQLGPHSPGIYVQANHWFMLDVVIRSLRVAGGAATSQCDPALLEDIRIILRVWDSIGGEAFLNEISISAIHKFCAFGLAYPSSCSTQLPCPKCKVEQPNNSANSPHKRVDIIKPKPKKSKT